MKKMPAVLLGITFSLGFMTASQTYAQTNSMMGNEGNEEIIMTNEAHGDSVETVLQDLLRQQQVSTVQGLDLTKISEDDWERLGDAVMELQHPGDAHEAMDAMMGGEGSESLRQMHINMGEAYLGNGDGYYGQGMMMGGGMTPIRQEYQDQVGYGDNRNFNTPTGMMGYGSMMGGYGAFGSYNILGTLIEILAIAFLASGTYFFMRTAHKK